MGMTATAAGMGFGGFHFPHPGGSSAEMSPWARMVEKAAQHKREGHGFMERPTTTKRPQVVLKKADHTAIPWQLITTGKVASLDKLPPTVRGNIEHTISLNPGMMLRYFSDDECHDYIKTNFDEELAAIYKKEPAGHFRGDICR